MEGAAGGQRQAESAAKELDLYNARSIKLAEATRVSPL